MNDLSYIASFLQARDGFTVIAHISPDGDTLGSSLALYGALLKMGKRAQVVCENPVPAIYRFLPFADRLLAPAAAEFLPNAVCVDCAAKDRLGAARPHFEKAGHSINIDHHVTNEGYADDNCIRDAGATGEIVFDMLDMMGLMDAQIATCLYTALVTDTGNFAYANTTPETLRKAAELLEDGADCAHINRCVYRTVPLRKTRLLGMALAALEVHGEARIGLLRVRQGDMRAAGATSEDVEGLIDHARDVDTVEIAIMARESSQPGVCKVSLRSKNYADVSKIAAAMGGGGHKRAAGYTDCGDLEAVCARAVDMAQRLLDEA